MTSRLLRRSLGSPTYEPVQDELREATSTPLLALRNLELRASVLPLFRRDPDDPAGALLQVVRVRLRVSGGGRLTVALRDGDGALVDETSWDFAAGGAWVTAVRDLWVPEVREGEARRVTVEVADTSGPVGSGALTVTPQRKWTVYVVHHSHLDIGYTDPQGIVLRNHLEYLDSVLDLVAATSGDGWDDDARFRWNVESNLPARRWLEARPEAARARMAEAARQGRVEITAMPFQLHTEACSTEELQRMLRGVIELRERYGIPVRSAMHTDVPGATVGLIDALAAVGIPYLSAAHNWAGRSVPYLVGGQELTRPFWWRAPSGNRLLVWHTDTPHGIAYMEGNLVGLAAGYNLALDLVPAYLSALASRPWPFGGKAFGWSGLPEGAEVTMRPYPHDIVHLRVQGSDADNAGPSLIPASIVRAWNQAWAFPRLRMATNHDFLAAAEERLGGALDEFEGDWTDWWADGLGSGARPLGYARRAQRDLRAAETLHALADVRPPAENGDGDGEMGVSVGAAVDAAYDKLALFDEHSWGSANPWTDGEEGVDSGAIQWARKASFAHDGADDAADLLHAGVRRLGATFARVAGALASIVVFNPSSGEGARTDLAEVWVPASVVDSSVPLALVDGRDGTPVPLLAGPPETVPFRPRGRRLRFIATDLPPLGYARLDLVTGPVEAHSEAERAAVSAGLGAAGLGSAGAAAIPVTNGVVALENEFYRVGYDLTEGYIASVFDKAAGRELVNQDAVGGLNQYVRDRYATAPHFNHLSGHVVANDLTLLGGRFTGHGATVVRAERTAVGERLEVELHGDGTDWIRTVVELPRGVRRVDLTNRIAKVGGAAKESVFFAFPFAMQSPPAAWELAGGVGGSEVAHVPGSAHYLQYLRHWVAFEEAGMTLAWATLEAPLVQFGNIHLPYAPFPPTLDLPHPEPATIWSWAMNNIWDTNFPSEQRGETTFRYALTSAAGEGTSARQLGPVAAAGLVEPLVAVLIGGPAPAAGAGALDPSGGPAATVGTSRGGPGRGTVPPEPPAAAPAAGSFVTVSDPLVQVTSLGRSRRGHALMVRLRSLAPEAVEATLRFPLLRPSRAFAGTLLEEGLAELAVDAGDGAVRVRLPACGTAAVAVDL